jgi:beta-carotene 15,15'-dioxygenase
MNGTREQGLLFVAIALFVSLYHTVVGLPEGQRLLPVLALLIVLVGIPHGALDTLLASRMFGIQTAAQWALFSTGYLGLVVIVMAAWQEWPFPLLLLFVTVSAGHFAGDPEEGCPGWVRIVYGCAPVVLPALLYGDEVLRLFSFLAPATGASRLVEGLSMLAWPVAISLGVAAVLLVRRRWRTALEIAGVATLAALTPPLLSFTVFFCGMHSSRHVLRCLQGAGVPSTAHEVASRNGRATDAVKLQQALRAGLPPMAATLALLAMYWAHAGTVSFEPRLIQTVFIGLAALTFPHVIVVDGLSRWRPASLVAWVSFGRG